MNKLAMIAVVAASAATFGVAGAFAQSGGDFAKADANQDKTVTMEEAMGVYPTLTKTIFDQADANKDGTLDEAEFGGLSGLVGQVGDGGGSSSADASAMTDTSSSSAQ
jgi:outer membrane lipoprotein SlyB